MSWLSESVVIYKRDMQNMQSRGLRGLDLKTIVLVVDAQFQALRSLHTESYTLLICKKINYNHVVSITFTHCLRNFSLLSKK